MPLQRIAIVGKSGSGKTTLARQLSYSLDLPHIELDGIHCQSNWSHPSKEEMRQEVSETLDAHLCWISDGNYLTTVQDIVWTRADTLIWLDYPLHVALWRLFKRTLTRVFGNEDQRELWNGNRETLWHHLSAGLWTNLFAWCATIHWRMRREVPAVLQEKQYRHLNVLRFQSARETEIWLRNLRKDD